MSLRQLSHRLARSPIIGPGLRLALRCRIALPHACRPIRYFARWLFSSKEYTNFTYDLTELNKNHLIAFVSHVTGVDDDTVKAYLNELDQDLHLQAHIRRATEASQERVFADATPSFARRLGWYAIVRSIKPRVVVETGVDKGLGACILASALQRNSEEGRPGYYYGTDINPHAGYLFREPYTDFGKILYGDSIESLRGLDSLIDVFINDSDHSPEYEAREYQAIEDKLAESAFIISDNSHSTNELLQFAQRTGRRFLFFKEEPKEHWYSGAGIGVAF